MEARENPEFSGLLKYRAGKIALYNGLSKLVVSPILKYWLDIKVLGAEKIPRGSCVLVTNHAIYMDALVLGAVIDKKIHGWIAENVYSQRPKLYGALELISVKTGPCSTREEQKALLIAFNQNKKLSEFWIKNTSDAIALTSDGLAESCLDLDGNVKPLSARDNHSGPANLGFSLEAPIVHVTLWVPEKHRTALLKAGGLKSLKYLESNRRIPYKIYINEPLNPVDYSTKGDLQIAIRRAQISGWNFLETF